MYKVSLFLLALLCISGPRSMMAEDTLSLSSQEGVLHKPKKPFKKKATFNKALLGAFLLSIGTGTVGFFIGQGTSVDRTESNDNTGISVTYQSKKVINLQEEITKLKRIQKKLSQNISTKQLMYKELNDNYTKLSNQYNAKNNNLNGGKRGPSSKLQSAGQVPSKEGTVTVTEDSEEVTKLKKYINAQRDIISTCRMDIQKLKKQKKDLKEIITFLQNELHKFIPFEDTDDKREDSSIISKFYDQTLRVETYKKLFKEIKAVFIEKKQKKKKTKEKKEEVFEKCVKENIAKLLFDMLFEGYTLVKKFRDNGVKEYRAQNAGFKNKNIEDSAVVKDWTKKNVHKILDQEIYDSVYKDVKKIFDKKLQSLPATLNMSLGGNSEINKKIENVVEHICLKEYIKACLKVSWDMLIAGEVIEFFPKTFKPSSEVLYDPDKHEFERSIGSKPLKGEKNSDYQVMYYILPTMGYKASDCLKGVKAIVALEKKRV